VLWAPDGTEVSIERPAGLRQAYDLEGEPLLPRDGSLAVGFTPVYLEVTP
jgi:hypothetical protein